MAIFNINKIKESEEKFYSEIIIQEEAFAAKSGYSIHVEIGRDPMGTGRGYNKGFLLDPYFKFFDSDDKRTAKNDARISLLDGHLIPEHTDRYGTLKIKNSEKRWLEKALKDLTNNKKFSGQTTFEAMWSYLEGYANSNNLQIATRSNVNNVIEGIKNI